jgi:molecular chaperone GrpE
MGTRSMDTENRKPAADEQANDQADDQANDSTGMPQDAEAAQAIEPETSAAEDSISGWTAPVGGAAEAAATETGVYVESDADAIVRLEAEKADLTDRLLRVVAEMDNLRKRTEREVSDARKFSLARFAGDMLSVSDNLKRALDAVPPEARETHDEALDALLAGVEMTGREMERMLEKNGVTRIAVLGERFDPHCHQAMFEVPDETVPSQTIVEVVQDGYRIGERILRAAMVGVSKGGPKSAMPEAEPEPEQEPADDDSETDLPEPPQAA